MSRIQGDAAQPHRLRTTSPSSGTSPTMSWSCTLGTRSKWHRCRNSSTALAPLHEGSVVDDARRRSEPSVRTDQARRRVALSARSAARLRLSSSVQPCQRALQGRGTHDVRGRQCTRRLSCRRGRPGRHSDLVPRRPAGKGFPSTLTPDAAGPAQARRASRRPRQASMCQRSHSPRCQAKT